VTLFH
jgi:hypothetical protein